MKKIIVICIILLITVFLSASKYTGRLYYQILFKNQYQEGALKEKPALIKHSPDLDNQLIFIHFSKKPSYSQLKTIENLGIIIDYKSWTPPIKNHPTGFYSASMPASIHILKSLSKMDFIKKLGTAENYFRLNTDLAAIDTGVSEVDSTDNITGEGVKIAVIDSGFELGHGDLPTPLVAIDYSNYQPASPDSDFTVSNEHTGTPHGTYVAGIIVGQGTLSNGRWKGMARGAQWMGFKVAKDYTGFLSTTGINHAFKAARFYYGADFVNASFGGWDDFHDGSDETSQIVDLISEDGCCVFIASGNEAARKTHYTGILYGGETSYYITVNTDDSNRATYTFNLVWYDSPDTTEHTAMSMEFFNSNHNHMVVQGESDIAQSYRGTHSRSGYCTTVSNTFYIKVTNLSERTMRYHIYADSRTTKFAYPSKAYTVDIPALADLAFSVGAHTTRTQWQNYEQVASTSSQTINDLTSYSNRGPRVDGYQEPFITAPGSMIISILDHDNLGGPPYGSFDAYVISNDYENGGLPADYIILEGTSAASPVACGAAALLKSYYPNITREQLAEKLRNNAKQDGYTGIVPNSNWGAGKIDVYSSLQALKYDLTPLHPQNVQISVTGGNVHITWEPVTSTNNGTSITPSYYKVYVYDSPHISEYTETFDCASCEVYLPISNDKKFYRVRAIYNP